ncbi:molybdopterin synthase catalytic subunit [Rubrivirga sp.]|uniref:molybdopterin synthase catalytic subunit n=1 Tax=Rubrivirga sp. TaxID=1885344 RepID=UPI003B529F23
MVTPSDRWTALSERPLDLGAVHSFLADDRAGGTCVFVGTSRRWTDGVETDLLTYEAYSEMAEAELARLAEVAADRWDAARVVVLHRLGAVPPPQASVVVGVACAHRGAAFEAARWLIDTLKESTPIWKTEHPAHA